MFALVDCNNFYASCERVFRPDLNKKPIVILSNNDGCIISRSNEAKALGIPMGAPAFKYAEQLKKQNICVFSANFPLYGDMSNRVMTILSDYTPDIEIYSIDEAFLKFNGMEHSPLQEIGNKMHSQVMQWTGIPICVGMAPTKSLAKAANRIAKKYPEHTHGVYLMDTEEKRIKALKWLPIEDVWGIGRQHAKLLKAMNIDTAYDFSLMSEQWVHSHMSVVGLRLQQDLQGTPILDLEEIQPKKNIATTRSFETNYTTLQQLAERITTFACICAEKLRQQNANCNSLSVFIRSNVHQKTQQQYRNSIFIQLPYPTNSNIEIAKYAVQGLTKIFREGHSYKKAGVILQDFIPETTPQLNLFENRDERHIPLMQTIDALNKKYGQAKIRLAAQDQKRIWKMRQEHLSPRYTTNINDIITVHV